MNYACLKGRLVKVLVDYFETDYRRIAHALEVLKHVELLQHNLR